MNPKSKDKESRTQEPSLEPVPGLESGSGDTEPGSKWSGSGSRTGPGPGLRVDWGGERLPLGVGPVMGLGQSPDMSLGLGLRLILQYIWA